MKHFHNLSLDEFKEFVNSPSYNMSQKIDGSCFRFGYDELGYYSSTKGSSAHRYRSAEEYNQYWANNYRACHEVGQRLLVELGISVVEPIEIHAEIIGKNRTNAIWYNTAYHMVITTNLEKSGVKSPIYQKFDVRAEEWYSLDGVTIIKRDILSKWIVTHLPYSTHSTDVQATSVRDPSYIIQQGESKHIDAKLNYRLPDGISKLEILEGRREFSSLLYGYARLLVSWNYPNNPEEATSMEGVVLSFNDKLVKIQHPSFIMMNDFYHKWQDRIYSCESISQLDQTLEKYYKNPYRCPDAHDRTLLLFAEERTRLHGW